MATIHADTSRLAFQIIACSYISKVTRVYNMGKTLPSFSLQTIQMSFATPEWPLKGRKWELSHVIFGLAYFQTNPFPGFAGFGTPTKIKHLPFFDSVVGLFILGKLNIYIYIYYIYFDLAKSEVVVTKKVISKVLSQWPQPFPHWLPRPVGCPALSWPWPPGMPPPDLPSAAGAAWDGERGLTSLRRLRLGSCRVLSGMCIIFPNSMSISYDRNIIYIYIYT